MNIREMRRKIQEKTFMLSAPSVPNIEIICSIQTENEVIKGKLTEIKLEDRKLVFHFLECFPRS